MSVQIVDPDEQLLVTTKQGVVIRCPVSDIGVKGRATRGVRVIALQAGDSVASLARLEGGERISVSPDGQDGQSEAIAETVSPNGQEPAGA